MSIFCIFFFGTDPVSAFIIYRSPDAIWRGQMSNVRAPNFSLPPVAEVWARIFLFIFLLRSAFHLPKLRTLFFFKIGKLKRSPTAGQHLELMTLQEMWLEKKAATKTTNLKR